MLLKSESQSGLLSQFVRMFISILYLILFSLVFYPNLALSQHLYAFENSSGVITYTSRKPSGGKRYKLVTPKTPKYSVFVHRGLGYYWSAFPKPSSYDDLIDTLSAEYGLDSSLVKAVMHVESAFNPKAVSRAGARGLMQLMPATASRFGVKNSFDPEQNMRGGMKYLSWLNGRFGGNLSLVLAGYNAGEGAVDKYKGIPPYQETRDYVNKVIRMAGLYRDDFYGVKGHYTKQKTKNNDKHKITYSSNKARKGAGQDIGISQVRDKNNTSSIYLGRNRGSVRGSFSRYKAKPDAYMDIHKDKNNPDDVGRTRIIRARLKEPSTTGDVAISENHSDGIKNTMLQEYNFNFFKDDNILNDINSSRNQLLGDVPLDD